MATVTAQDADGTPIPLLDLRITGDTGSWSYSLEASIPDPEAARRVIPTADGAHEITLDVQGYLWRFVVERYGIERRLARYVYRIEGRSPTAWLAEPHAPPRTRLETETRQAVQLAAKELEYTGTTLDWRAPNWVVPGGVWGYQDKTPMWALSRIAQTVGAFVRSHRHRKEVQIVRRYPVSPPDWPTASGATIPVRLIEKEAAKWEGDERLAIAWVMGDSDQGVVVRGYRAAWDQYQDGPRSAGNTAHELVTDVTAGSALATYRIDQTGPKLMLSLTTTMEHALVDPDSFKAPATMVRLVGEGIDQPGLVHSTEISAEERQGAVSVSQSMKIETRPEEAEWR